MSHFLFLPLPASKESCFSAFFQETSDKRLASWQRENENLTREACTGLLKRLKEEHLDPILARLHGEGGAKVSFEDIIQGYNKLEQDYKVRVIGAKDVCAAVFFEFHPVKKNTIFTVFICIILTYPSLFCLF